MKILVVSPHPDDLELNCAGTLLRFKDQGHTVISVVTVRPSKEDSPQRKYVDVSAELTASYNKSNFELRVFETPLHENGRPNLVSDNNTMTQLWSLLEPADIIILPNPQDSHQDHVATFNLAWPFAKKYGSEVWLTESFPYCRTYQSNTANLHVDITDYYSRKLELIKCYSSYFSSKDINDIGIANQWWGQHTNGTYAEAFTVRRRII